jgi:hypothetical protein
MTNYEAIATQVVFAIYCFGIANYIGQLRNIASINRTTTGEQKLFGLRSAWVFDIASLWIILGYGLVMHNVWISLVLVFIYRLVFTKTVNYYEWGSVFYLDESKMIDRWVRYAFRISKNQPGNAATLVEMIILLVVIVIVNLLFLIK